MGVHIEAIILYIVLFLSGSAGGAAGGTEAAGFSSLTGLAGIFLYSIPSLALIWYLLLKVKKIKDWGIMPGKRDVISGIITFPCLFITGLAIAFISSFFDGSYAPVPLHSPATVMGWVILCIYCISAAYLEESFFRFYILSRRNELKLSASQALALSAVLFSICHIYEGPWGFLNSFLSAVILAFIFLRYHALHGIAVAHGLYNIAVYAVNAIMMKN